MNSNIVSNIKTTPAALAAGRNRGLYPGLVNRSSIITGRVVHSVNLTTTQDAPNSPNEIATTKDDATIIEGARSGNRIDIRRWIGDAPNRAAAALRSGSMLRIEGRIIRTTKGVVIIT
jgi:hypothetical protein